jgi:histidinol phosphatase-like enzyme
MYSYNRKLGIVLTASSIFYTGGEGKFIDIFTDTQFRPAVLPILRKVHCENYPIFLICNVGEVLESEFSVESLHAFYEAVQDFLIYSEIRIVQIYYECNLKSRRALPHPTMINDVCTDFNYKPEDLLVVGRDYIDFQAASRGGFEYWHGHEFFNTLVPKKFSND